MAFLITYIIKRIFLFTYKVEHNHYIIIVIFNRNCLFLLFYFSPADSNQMKEIKDSWVFYTKDDPDFKFDSKYTRTIPTVDKDETFIMETTLEKPLDEANLLIKGNHQWITVYLGEKILYQRKDYQEESNPGLSLAVIDLPANYIGKN